MNFPRRAVIFLDEISTVPTRSKPLMLEAVLFCPILRWMRDKLQADGVQRFFVVCSPRFEGAVRACFPEDGSCSIFSFLLPVSLSSVSLSEKAWNTSFLHEWHDLQHEWL